MHRVPPQGYLSDRVIIPLFYETLHARLVSFKTYEKINFKRMKSKERTKKPGVILNKRLPIFKQEGSTMVLIGIGLGQRLMKNLWER